MIELTKMSDTFVFVTTNEKKLEFRFDLTQFHKIEFCGEDYPDFINTLGHLSCNIGLFLKKRSLNKHVCSLNCKGI